MVMLDRGILKIMRGGAEIYKKSLNWVRPGEMISVEIPAGTLGVASTAGEPFEISLNAAGEGVK